MAELTCEGCEELIEDGSDRGNHIDFNGEDWHEMCFEVGGGSSSKQYCCGSIYEEGEVVCASCGDPL